VHRDGGAVEVAAEAPSVEGALAALDRRVFFAIRTGRNDSAVSSLDVASSTVTELATLDRETRGIVAIRSGLILQLWDGDGGGGSLAFLPFGRAERVTLDDDGGAIAVDDRHAYWGRAEEGLVRVCLDYFDTL